MLVKEIMSKQVDIIHFDSPVQEAAVKMANGNFGALPVEKNDKMIGMITDRDIAIRLVAPRKDPLKTTVEECMTKGIEFCFEDDDVSELARKMQHSRHRRIPVINSKKRLVGIVSVGDLAVKVRNKELTQSTFEQICW
jgi:CBS domain-containing protein